MRLWPFSSTAGGSTLEEVDGYWVTGKRAAAVLGVNEARLRVLAGKGFIPFENHADGTRLFRREQLEVVAQSRDARRLSRRSGVLR